MRAALALLCLMPIAGFAEPREVAEVTINNQEAKLFDDGTWAFVNPDVAMPDVDAVRCVGTADARLSFCPDLAFWVNQVVVVSPGVEDHTFQSHDQGFTLVAAADTSFGHGGDLASYADNANSGGLFGQLASRALGLGAYTDQSFVVGDVAVLLGQYTEPGTDYSSDTIDVMLENQTLHLDLVSVLTIPGVTEKPADFNPTEARAAALKNLQDSIAIDGKPLSAIIQEVQE